MTVLDASNALTKIFNMADPVLVAFSAPVPGGTAASATWKTVYDPPISAGFPGERAILQAAGQNFTFDTNGKLTGGELTALHFTLGETGTPDTNVNLLSGVPLSVAGLLAQGTREQQSQSFWAALLSGNDTILAPQQKNVGITGDFYQFAGNSAKTSLAGGDDLISADFTRDPLIPVSGVATTDGTTPFRGLVGDCFTVSGMTQKGIDFRGTLFGGADTITMSGFAGHDATGDAHTADNLGIVRGGDDRITNNAAGNPLGSETQSIKLNGDVAVALPGSAVVGGRDTVLGSDFAFYGDIVSGDVNVIVDAFVTGGNDDLDGRGGQDRIAGDVFTVIRGEVNGGDDRISGGEDSDLLSGDVFSTNDTSAVRISGGNDVIDAGNGNDRIAGDVLSLGLLPASGVVDCGDDVILGGDGNDTIFGDFGALFAPLGSVTGGNDRLDGGLGDDIIHGQDGIDVAVFLSEAIAVTVDLAAGTANGQGSDILTGIEDVAGSILADRISGDSGANRLLGNAGDDRLDGRGGRDVISGGEGADQLQGGGGADRFLFAPVAGPVIATDRILDFADGKDVLDLRGFGFESFGDVRALASDTANGLLLDLPGAERVLIASFALAAFSQADTLL